VERGKFEDIHTGFNIFYIFDIIIIIIYT